MIEKKLNTSDHAREQSNDIKITEEEITRSTEPVCRTNTEGNQETSSLAFIDLVKDVAEMQTHLVELEKCLKRNNKVLTLLEDEHEVLTQRKNLLDQRISKKSKESSWLFCCSLFNL